MTGEGGGPPGRLKRLLAFPLLLFYCAVLVVGAWPRQLMFGRAMATAQLGADFVLAELGWPAGMAVFTGQDRRDAATVRTCFRLLGVTANGEGKVLFDTMRSCRENRRSALKDPLELYLTRTLVAGTRQLHRRGAPMDRNAYPLNDMFAVLDWFCHKDGLPFERVAVTARTQSLVLGDGRLADVTIDEGAHHCAVGAWEPIGLRRSPL